jgi:hypothetical protein
MDDLHLTGGCIDGLHLTRGCMDGVPLIGGCTGGLEKPLLSRKGKDLD